MILSNIQALCDKNNMSVTALEKTLEFGDGTIRKWDKSSPTVDKLAKVAKFFKVSIDSLVKPKR